MNSTNDDPEEKNEAQEESEAIEQEHEVDAAEDIKPWKEYSKQQWKT